MSARRLVVAMILLAVACAKEEPAPGPPPIQAEVQVPVGESAAQGTYEVVVTQSGGPEQRVTGERVGRIQSRWVADVTGDGSPEVIVWLTSGANALGTVHVYENRGGTWAQRPIAALSPEQREGHRGHDQFLIEGGKLTRRYPEYASSHPDAGPTGTSIHLAYSFASDTWIPAP